MDFFFPSQKKKLQKNFSNKILHPNVGFFCNYCNQKLKIFLKWNNALLFWTLEWMKIFFISMCILFWLIFPYILPEIPLIAYHLIQKGKLYLLGHKTRTQDSLLVLLSRVFAKLPTSNRNLQRTWDSFARIYFQWKEKNVLI